MSDEEKKAVVEKILPLLDGFSVDEIEIILGTVNWEVKKDAIFTC